jgi:hypothetical protein
MRRFGARVRRFLPTQEPFRRAEVSWNTSRASSKQRVPTNLHEEDSATP